MVFQYTMKCFLVLLLALDFCLAELVAIIDWSEENANEETAFYLISDNVNYVQIDMHHNFFSTQIEIQYYKNEKSLIVLTYLVGFQTMRRPFLIANTSITNVIVRDSVVDFYLKNGKLINCASSNLFETLLMDFYDLKTLNSQKITQLIENYTSVFGSSFKSIIFNQSVYFNSPLSSLMFKNARIEYIEVQDITDTFVRRKTFEFASEDHFLAKYNLNSVDLNASITVLRVKEFYNLDLKKLVSFRLAFKNLEQLHLFGLKLFVYDDTFKYFSKLKAIFLKLENFGSFIYQSTNKWMESLNSGVNNHSTKMHLLLNKSIESDVLYKAFNVEYFFTFFMDFYVSASQFTSVSSYYLFPDEDLCQFKYLHHEQLVFPVAINKNNFTCLLQYLDKFTVPFVCQNLPNFYNEMIDIDENYTKYCLENINFDTDSKCDTDEILKMCQVSQFGIFINKIKSINIDDLASYLKSVEFVCLILLFPVTAFIGFILNLIMILVICDKKNYKEYFKGQRAFTFILINSTFNMLECLISCMRIMSICFGNDSIYCSSIAQTHTQQYFRIYVVEFFGEILKSMSIFTMTCFSFERYMSSSNSNNKILLRLQKVKIRYYIGGFFLFSIFLSYHKIDDYRIFDYYWANYALEFPSLHLGTLLLGPDYYRAFLYINYLFNDMIMFLVNLFIDILMVKKIRDNLKLKKETYFKIENMNHQHRTFRIRNKQLLNKIESTNKDLNAIIIFSLLSYFLFRMPEMIIYFIFYSPEWRFRLFMRIYIIEIMPLAFNFVQFLYVCSYIVNFLFFLNFNKNIRLAFMKYFHLTTDKIDQLKKNSKKF